MSDETLKNAEEQTAKIQSLRDMISNAERTMQSAKAMLLQLEGKKKAGRRHKLEEDEEGGTIIQGTFDGQVMLGSDGKQYPVPANYASKSKLVEGDLLKLHITAEGSFVYKQIGPVERKHALGIVTQDEGGNYIVIADGKSYRILLASITYFKAQSGDEAAIVTSRDIDSQWASLENIIAKAKYDTQDIPLPGIPAPKKSPAKTKTSPKTSSLSEEDEMADEEDDDDFLEQWRKDLEQAERELALSKEDTQKTSTPKQETKATPTKNTKNTSSKQDDDSDLLEEWRADTEAIEKEIAEAEKTKLKSE